MSKLNKTIESYDLHADEYQVEADKRGIRARDVQLLFSYLKGIKNPVVVELGCAHGRDAGEIVKYTNQYFGMDASEKLIEKARGALPDLHFEVSTFENYTLPKKVDAVVSFASLLHADKKVMSLVLKKAFQALNHGGIVFLSLQEGKYEERIKKDNMGTRAFYYYMPVEIEIMAPFFKRVFVEEQNIRDKKWFIIIFRKD